MQSQLPFGVSYKGRRPKPSSGGEVEYSASFEEMMTMKEWGILPHEWLSLPSLEKASLLAYERERTNLDNAITEARKEDNG